MFCRLLLRLSRTDLTTPSNLHPHIVATTSRNDAELLAWEILQIAELVLSGAVFLERLLGFLRKELCDDARDGVVRQAARCEIDLAGRGQHVRLVADMQDERVAVNRHDGAQQRRNEAHEAGLSPS